MCFFLKTVKHSHFGFGRQVRVTFRQERAERKEFITRVERQASHEDSGGINHKQ